MTVVLIGDTDLKEFELLAGAVEDRGSEAVLWDTKRWPSDVPVTFEAGGDTITVDEPLSRDAVTGVFAWPHQMFDPLEPRFADALNEEGIEHAHTWIDAWRGTFNALLQSFEHQGATVFFPPRTQHYHDTKPLQLVQFRQAGVSVPDTVFSASRLSVSIIGFDTRLNCPLELRMKYLSLPFTHVNPNFVSEFSTVSSIVCEFDNTLVDTFDRKYVIKRMSSSP